jgi:D-3-phosphoglycerate dehydrogenase / 2-oxoglutarate reductase
MSRFRVVVTDQVFPDVNTERELFEAAGGELVAAQNRAQALELIRDADAVLNTYMPIDRQMISTLTQAKIIARNGIGVDNIDIAGPGPQASPSRTSPTTTSKRSPRTRWP